MNSDFATEIKSRRSWTFSISYIMSTRSWVFSAVNSILQEWQPNDYDACKFSKHSMQNIPVKDKLSQLDEIFIMLKEFSKKFLRT